MAIKLNFRLYNFTQNWLNKNKANVYLTTNVAAGSSRPGSYYTSKTGDICSSSQEFIDLMKSYRGKAIVVMKFNNIKEAQNCKIALKNPILRMCLVKFMCDQNIKKSYYKYIPDIDWSDNKTLTDEGILEMCGFTKNEAKEFAKYCEDFMNNVYVINNKPKKTVRKVTTISEKEKITKVKPVIVNKAKTKNTLTNKQTENYNKLYGAMWRIIDKTVPTNKKQRSVGFALARKESMRLVINNTAKNYNNIYGSMWRMIDKTISKENKTQRSFGFGLARKEAAKISK